MLSNMNRKITTLKKHCVLVQFFLILSPFKEVREKVLRSEGPDYHNVLLKI